MRRLLILAGVAVLALSVMGAHQMGDVADTLFQRYQAGQPVPLPNQLLEGKLDQRGAYEVQGLMAAKLIKAGHEILGYKAGLTSAPAQKKFSAPGPASGVLFDSMLRPGGVVLAKPYTKMMLEVEIGYRLADDVESPVTAKSVRDKVAAVLPVVEVPDLAFETFKGLSFVDIVAANVGARGVILGQEADPAAVDVNAATGQLFMGGQKIGPAVPGKAALGDQWKALAWTINNVREHGGLVEKGMLVITGSLGPMYPGKPGSYRAVYTGGLGEIAFTIE